MTYKNKGFTLIELLVVIAIIAILAAILFPIFARAREAGRSAACSSNLNQLGKAFKMYRDDYEGFMPYNLDSTGKITNEVELNNPSKLDFVRGVSKYIGATPGSGSKQSTVWTCPSAPATGLGGAGNGNGAPNHPWAQSAEVSYVLNGLMLGEYDMWVDHDAQTMLLREASVRLNAVLRPRVQQNTDPTYGDPYSAPVPELMTKSPDFFLDGQGDFANSNAKLHNGGTHILFYDGHTKKFKAGQLQDRDVILTNDQRYAIPTTPGDPASSVRVYVSPSEYGLRIKPG